MSAELSTPTTAGITRRPMPVIGIVGGIGSGKSAVAQWVAAQANVGVIDADQLGHAVLREPHVKATLRQLFGDGIFDAAGEVQRSSLAACVFGDGEPQLDARRKLERIVHPEIEHLILAEIARAERIGRDAVLLDAPVLLEAGWQRQCDAVVFVEVPEELRRQRVQLRSGWTLEELRRREASQMSLADKRRLSTTVIDNTGPVSEAGRKLLTFLRGE